MKALLPVLLVVCAPVAWGQTVDRGSEALVKRARVWLDGRLGVARPAAIRGLLSPAARVALGLETLKQKEQFERDLLAGKVLRAQQSVGYRISAAEVLGVHLRDRHAVVLARVRPVRAKKKVDLRLEETTWVRVGGQWYLATPHDLKVDRLRTATHVAARRTARRAAVDRALDWLAKHQDPSGSWKGTGWKGGKDCMGGITGRKGYDLSVTALALTTFARAGHTHKEGKHRVVVARGLEWLRAQRKADGALGFDRAKPSRTGSHIESRSYLTTAKGCKVVINKPPPAGPNLIYHHALASLALATLLEASGDPALRKPVGEAVAWIVAARNPHLAWGYGVTTGRNNTSITAWMLRALDAARRAGIEIPEKTLSGPRRWLRRATDASGWIGYESPGGGSSYLGKNKGRFESLPTMTGAGLVARRICGDPGSDAEVARGYGHLANAPPVWGPKTINFLYWHHGAEAFARRSWRGGVAWGEALRSALLKKQLGKGCEAGSWRPAGEWCGAGGGIYATAINVITLLQLRD